MAMFQKPEEQMRGGLLGLFDRATTANQTTGLNPLQRGAAALDALIMPELRMGQSIRQQGAARAADMSRNRTVETLRAQGRDDLAQAVLDGTIGGKEAFGVMQSEAAANKAFQRQKDLAAYQAGLKGPAAPKTYEFQAVTQALMNANPNLSQAEALKMALSKGPAAPKIYSELAKINADYQSGALDEQGYKLAVDAFANKNKMSLRTTPDGGVEFVQGADAGGKSMTESGSKNVIFYDRSKRALELFDPVANSLVNAKDALLEQEPTGLGRYGQSDEFQQAQVLGKDFLAPILRKDTGAAVTPSEWVFYKAIYIPEVGDNQAKLDEKRKARSRAVSAMRKGLNPHEIIAAEGVDTSNAPAIYDPSQKTVTHRYNPETGKVEPI